MGLIDAAGGLLGAGIGAIAQGAQNRKSRQWSEKMYARQYKDNVDFWRMQNQYNDPSQQMGRLKDAGLNPHLVYGGSSGGSAGTAGPVAKADTPTPQFTPVLGQNTDILGKYYNYEMQQAQTDNLKEQNNAIKSKVALDLANAILVGSKTKRNEIEMGNLKEILDTTLEGMKAKNAQTEVNIQFTRDENIRKAIRQGADLEEMGERILSMRVGRQQARKLIRSTELGNELKQLDINLKKRGIQPNDNILARMLSQWLKNAKLPSYLNKSMFFGDGKGNY